MPLRYVPDAGHVVWLNFTPQAERRAGAGSDPAAYNDKTSLMICCPVTTHVKNYPFEVLIAGTTSGAVLAHPAVSHPAPRHPSDKLI
jgi:mRNA interferase MazF